MLTERHYPLYLTHHELDDYLAQGWYRMNQMIFTCHFLYFNEGIYSPVWIRLPLNNFRFKKSLRKLINKNKKHFTIESQPASITYEKELLFHRYRANFKGQLANSLHDALLDTTQINIYDTQEICIYHEGRLVGMSYFDKGDKAIASILGIYDPAYAKYSLGFFSMLMEIEWAQENEKLFYYPGYIIPGRPRFDYKLRIGEVEYFSPTDRLWKPYNKIDYNSLPIFNLKQKLFSIRCELEKAGIPTEQVFYPLFEEELMEYHGKEFLKFPLVLSCYHRDDNLYPLTIEYDLVKNCYVLSRHYVVENLHSVYTHEMADRYDADFCCLSFLYRDILFLESNNFQLITEQVIQYGS